MRKRLILAIAVICLGWSLSISWASASPGTPGVGWGAFGTLTPTYLNPGGKGELNLYIYDTGELASTPGATVTDTLPEGLEAEPSGSCTGVKVVICQLGEVQPSPTPLEFNVPVKIALDAESVVNPVDRLSVTGGGASSPTNTKVPVIYALGEAGFGFANVDGWVTSANGAVDTQAGSHPYEATFIFAMNVNQGGIVPAGGEPHTLNVNLPPGLIGEPGAVPKCPREQFDAETCPFETAVGADIALILGGIGHFLVYNLVPPAGIAAEFGFDFEGTHIFLDAKVRSGGDYGITVHTIVPEEGVRFNTTTIWGVPGEHGTGAPAKPFLSLPTSCGRPLSFGLEVLGTWQNPSTDTSGSFPWHNSEGTEVGITGCERLSKFEPSISLSPDTSYSDTPAGLTARVRVPQGLNPEGLATSGLKEATVVLPEGVAINPGQATGLASCSQLQAALPGPSEDGELEVFDGPPSCPAGSKVGTDEISTPVLPNPLKGNVYVLESNPPDIKLLVAASGEGVNLKLIGEVHLNEVTGQLTTTFKGTPRYPGNPDAPLTEFVLSFNGGAQAALVTPPTCGVYRAFADFVPWASPAVADGFAESNFQIVSGPGGSGGAACTGPLPFTPVLTAGSTTDQAGGYTDFSTLLQRADGQQRIKTLKFTAPEGLSGMISKVPLCGEPQASTGECPESSQIGHTVVGSGPGPYPLFIPEAGQAPAPIYLTGPYEGAPFGLTIKVPIIAGPFNLGVEIVRARIEVDPHTAQVTVATDPLPSIIKGVPADLRSINAVIDRPGFMFNPTNCNAMGFTGVATSTEGKSAPLESHFQVGSCQTLKFKPEFKLSASAKTSRLHGASLTAKVLYPTVALGVGQATSQANLARVKVELPKRLPSRLTTLQKACTASVFSANPAGCPAASVVGHATVHTPLLPVPLSGPAYFVSHGNEAFPSLTIVLQGDNVTVDLVGTTFISKKGVTSTTFKEAPDVPFSSFELTLPEGPFSALAANGNLCNGTLSAPTEFLGQNGALIKQSTKLNVTGCPKHKSSTKKKKKKGKKSAKKR